MGSEDTEREESGGGDSMREGESAGDSKQSSKRSLGRDIGAGITTAIANVPDAMANAVLAGLNPVSGLYALLTGTPSAALTTSSQFLTVAVTAAMALAVGDALKPYAADADTARGRARDAHGA